MTEASSFEVVIPRFEKGRIVKKQALDELLEFPRSLAALALSKHTDGIVSGFEVKCAEDNRLTVSRGALKHQGELLAVHQERLVQISEFGSRLQLALLVKEVRQDADYKTFVLELVLRPCRAVSSGEYELARFQLEEGARLRGVQDYTGLEDFATEYNTLNLLHVSYAGARYPGIAPELIRFFALALLREGKMEPIDNLFCMQAMGGTVEREAVICYLCAKLHIRFQEYTNMEIFEFLKQISRNIQKGFAPAPAPTISKRRTEIL